MLKTITEQDEKLGPIDLGPEGKWKHLYKGMRDATGNIIGIELFSLCGQPRTAACDINNVLFKIPAGTCPDCAHKAREYGCK